MDIAIFLRRHERRCYILIDGWTHAARAKQVEETKTQNQKEQCDLKRWQKTLHGALVHHKWRFEVSCVAPSAAKINENIKIEMKNENER